MANRYPIRPLLATTILFIACGGTPSIPKTSGVSSASQLTAVPAVQFGAVPVGGTSSSSVAMTNTATDGSSITISQINITGAGFQIGPTPTLPFTLAPGESLTVAVDFTPTAGGTAAGKISIMSNASDAILPVSLSGNGNGSAAVTVTPAVMNFGNVQVGSSSVLNGTLSGGTSPITVSSVDQAGEGYVLSGVTFPLTVSAGQSVTFTVTFTPESPGTSIGSLSFLGDNSTSPSATLTGSGTESGVHSVQLSWTASSSSVIGYNVYRGLQSGGPYSKLTDSPQPVTTYADYGVQSGTTYYYVATSVNESSQESAYSNQTVATVP